MAKRARPAGCCSISDVRELSEADSHRLTGIFKALADPNRLEIYRLVAAQPGPVCACDIVERFDLAQPTVSHHLKVLCDAGLLQGRKSGLWRFYSADPDGAQTVSRLAALIS